eukprot:Gb_27369 [translate_table: standard]
MFPQQGGVVSPCGVPVQQGNLPARKLVRQLDFTSIKHGSSGGLIAGPVIDSKEGAPKKSKQCNCKNSRCLKLYCECFASGIYCDGCNCVNCSNNIENEAVRREAVDAILERNPNAFRPKIEDMGEQPLAGKHNKGCNCKKSGCWKKYCECYQANIFCSENCRCMDCKNYKGSEERRVLYHGDNGTSLNYAQLGANAAISGTTGPAGYSCPSPSKKRKTQELLLGQAPKDQFARRMAQTPQVNTLKNTCSVLNVSYPHSTLYGIGPLGIPSSKVTYRSLLADVIQPDTVKSLCKLLVIASSETAKACAVQGGLQNGSCDMQAEKGSSLTNNKDSSVSSTQNEETPNEKIRADMLDTDQGKKAAHGASSSNCVDGAEFHAGVDTLKQRAMSPGTLALMCDEQDILFTAPPSPSGGCRGASNHCTTQQFAEQERVVLSEFRDCLRSIITVGKTRATQYSTEAAMSMQMNQQPGVVPHLAKPVSLTEAVTAPLSVPFSVGFGSLMGELKASFSALSEIRDTQSNGVIARQQQA